MLSSATTSVRYDHSSVTAYSIYNHLSSVSANYIYIYSVLLIAVAYSVHGDLSNATTDSVDNGVSSWTTTAPIAMVSRFRRRILFTMVCPARLQLRLMMHVCPAGMSVMVSGLRWQIMFMVVYRMRQQIVSMVFSGARALGVKFCS